MLEGTLRDRQTAAALEAANSLWAWGFYDIAEDVRRHAIAHRTT